MKVALLPIFFLIAVVVSSTAGSALSCKDLDGKDVDWWIILKSPKNLLDHNKTDGTPFGYIDANSSGEFTWPDSANINDNSPLTHTIDAINAAGKDISLTVFNDQVPDGPVTVTFAHMKGFLAVDSDQAVHITHSFPKFPVVSSSGVIAPQVLDSELLFGQHALCWTLDASDANALAGNFVIDDPQVYYGSLPKSLEESLPDVALLHQMASVVDAESRSYRAASAKAMLKFSTVGGESLVSVAHNSSLDTDYFEFVLSPYLDSSFIVESWGRPYMASYCTSQDFKEENIKTVKSSGVYTWKSTNDHSKWAVSSDSSGYVCLNDNNRMTSQRTRGGGSTCFNNPAVLAAFTAVIDTQDDCPTDFTGFLAEY